MADAILFFSRLLVDLSVFSLDGVAILSLIAAVSALALVLGAIIRTVSGGGGVKHD